MENTVFSPKTPTVVQLSWDLVTLKATAYDSRNIFLVIKGIVTVEKTTGIRIEMFYWIKVITLNSGFFFFNVPLVCMQAIIERATSLQRKNYPNLDEALFHSGWLMILYSRWSTEQKRKSF